MAFKRLLLVLSAVCALLALNTQIALASEIFTEDTGKDCPYCHIGDNQDLKFTAKGEAFVANYYKWPLPVHRSPFMKALIKKIRRVLLAVHALAGFALVGGLIFRGIASPPQMENNDIPRRETMFIWISFFLAAVAGLALLPFVTGDKDFWTTNFGMYLTGKIALSVILLFSTAYLTLIVGRRIGALRIRLDEETRSSDLKHFDKFSPADLKRFTGHKGKRALVAFKGKVFDVTDNPHWKRGFHYNRHAAGRDLTKEIIMAPHKNTVMQSVSIVGEFDPEASTSGSPYAREFEKLTGRYYVMARLNVFLAIGIVLAIAFWRQ